MATEPWTIPSALASTVVFALIGAYALVDRGRSPMGPALGRMVASLFAYQALDLLRNLTGDRTFFVLEGGAACLVAPTTARLVLVFLGRERAQARLLFATALGFGIVLVLSLAGLAIPALEGFAGSPLWAAVLLIGVVPLFGYLLFLLHRHAHAAGTEEKLRTQLLVLALAVGVLGATSDLLSIAGFDTPRFSAQALVVSALTLAALTFRFAFLSEVRGQALVFALLLTTLFLGSQALLYRFAGERPTLVALLTFALALALVATVRPMWTHLAERREREQRLVTMGRFASQMAHDLRNPLAAIRGAAQFLDGELQAGRPLDEGAAFVGLILEQADRLEKLIAEYRRLGKADPRRVPTDVHGLVEKVLAAARLASPVHRFTHEGTAQRASIDPELVEGALENLLRNAWEASPPGSTIHVTIKRHDPIVSIAVTDEGPGIEPRVRERIFDDFMTTKATGTGLGLAFVQRVAEAHGGRARHDAEHTPGSRFVLELHDRPEASR